MSQLQEGPQCQECGWNYFALHDGQPCCTKCGVVNNELASEIQYGERRQSDTELLASARYIVDRSKLIPIGMQHGQISEASKGFTANFHPLSGARDFQEHRITQFFNDPYKTGQIVDRGSKIEMQYRNIMTLACGHIKATARDVVLQQYFLCKKCRARKEITKVERKLMEVATKKSTDDLLFWNTMNRVDAISKDLRFDAFTRDCYGGVAREEYQTGVNWFEQFFAVKALLDMTIDYKGLRLAIYKKYYDMFVALVDDIRKQAVATLKAGEQMLTEIEQKEEIRVIQ